MQIRKNIKTILLCLTTAGLFLSCSALSDIPKGGYYFITGKIVDNDQNPVVGAEVSVVDTNKTTRTGADGTYTIKGLGRDTVTLKAEKRGFVVVPEFVNKGDCTKGNAINVGNVAKNGLVSDANFRAVVADSITISDIQGFSARSPLEGEYVTAVTGVVTMVSNFAPHYKYNNSTLADEDCPQFVGNDGFYLEALPGDKDLSGKKSNGIFVSTHDNNYTDVSKWKEGIPTDIEAGDVVTVFGYVEEVRHKDHYGSSDGQLTRTELNADKVYHVKENGTNKKAAYPDGVLITYSKAKADAWIAGHETDGKREARVMCYDVDDPSPMQKAIDIFESLEGMLVRIEDAVVVCPTYYNVTGVLADSAKKEDGTYFRTFNETFCVDVIQENEVTGYQDYNEEMLLVDYQATDWNTFYPLTQPGDYLVDSTGARVFRGVMDYTDGGLYMARPINSEPKAYLDDTNATSYKTPYFTTYAEGALTSVTGQTISSQGWDFDVSDAWYKVAGAPAAAITAMNSDGVATTKSSSSNIAASAKPWRVGTSGSSFDAASIFTPKWKSTSSTSSGNTTGTDLTLGAFNFENYDAQGSSNDKDKEIALIIKNNMLYPDVITVVEMGDDKSTTILYYPDDNQYANNDGIVTAVRNFSDIIDIINKTYHGPKYEFRCIDPKWGDNGGKGGVNIRVGFLYNTETVEFVDDGIVTNTYATTHDSEGNFLDESKWPVQTEWDNPQGLALANAITCVYKGADGNPHLTQSPALLQSSWFARSRRPLVGEFKHKATGKNFFVIGCHLNSKRGDYSLYGEIQPSLQLSVPKRMELAKVVKSFVDEILAIDPDAYIAVCGDMNDYAYSNAMKVLTGSIAGKSSQVLFSLSDEYMPVNERFSLNFQGNLQQIDHIFVTKTMLEKTKTEGEADWKNVCFIPHIDSIFNRNNHINTADHDPDLARIPGAF